MVNYRGLKANSGKLRAYVAAVGRLAPGVYAGWSEKDKIAFLVNAYNGITLQVIIDHYPIKPTFPAKLYHPDSSIRQIEGVWDELEFRVMGRMMTLEDIEHGTLRKDFDEPRIHMALVCAAMGCPSLRNEPYRGEELDGQFDAQARQLLRDPLKFRIDRPKDRLYLSPIFDWFGKDFIAKYGTSSMFRGHDEGERAVLNYVSRYLSAADRRYLASGDYKIKHLDYDWSLNEQKPGRR
jgi:hypothetical protein